MQLAHLYKTTLRLGALTAGALLCALPATAQYVTSAIVLNPAGFANSASRTNIPGTQYGYGVVGSSENALAWHGSNLVTNLNPTNMTGGSPTYTASLIFAQAGGQEGGFATNAADGNNHAVIWNGTSTLVTDVHPATFGGLPTLDSAIYGMSTDGTSTGIQVGEVDENDGTTHAAAWFGSASSAIDLSTQGGLICPTCYSQANGVNTSDQVVGEGFGSITGYLTHAVLWNVNASNHTFTVQDLNPTGASVSYNYSQAYAVDGSTAVGYGVNVDISANNRALAWNISNPQNITYTDLSTALGSAYTASTAEGVKGGYIVGNAATTGTIIVNGQPETTNVTHAILWSQGGTKFLDLNSSLPDSPIGTPYIDSYAYGVTANGSIVGIADYNTYNASGGVTGTFENAVLWQVTVPAPASLPVLASGLVMIGGALARRRRKA
jgi:hypothetical protein